MIDLLPDDDQQAVADNIADVLAAEAPVSRLRDGRPEDAGLTPRLAALGWLGMGLPESDGGAGYGLAEEALMFRAAGRHLLSPGFLAACLGARIAAAAGDEVAARTLATGEASACLLSPLGAAEIGAVVSGLFHRLDGADSDFAIAFDKEGAVLLDNRSLNGEPLDGIDDAVMLERVDLAGVKARCRLTAEVERVDLRADLLIAAILTGGAEGARDLAVAYAGMREQFGQPIGAFQGVKHACADMAVRCEAAWSLTAFAALALQDDRADAEFQVLSALVVAEDAALRNAAKAVQVHGGIGFTAECDAQLFVKRMRLWTGLGPTRRARLAALLAQPEPVRASRARLQS